MSSAQIIRLIDGPADGELVQVLDDLDTIERFMCPIEKLMAKDADTVQLVRHIYTRAHEGSCYFKYQGVARQEKQRQ